MTIRGSCACGVVTYEIAGAFKGAGNCHCSICRKVHGAAYATWAHIDPEQFRWTSGEEQLERYSSSPGQERYFCSKCSAPLVAAASGRIVEVVLGTADGDPGTRPGEHIFVGSRAPWHEITDGLPQFDEWPVVEGISNQ